MPLLAALIAMLALIASPSSRAEEGGQDDRGERVRGHGYSATTLPPVTDDPPDDFLADADVRGDDETAAYTGLDAYDLKNGAKDDDKKGWASTDYIHWLAQGATLVAYGQVQDSDDAASSEVSSSAWGATVIDAEVTREEGEFGTISAENKIAFSYMYDISGPRILDAKVLLHGTCVDILGKNHTFNLSEVRSESVTERLGIRRVHVRREGSRANVSAGALARGRPQGVNVSTSVGASVETVHEVESGETINTSIERALPGAGGQTGSESAPAIEDSVSGNTTLKKSYSVFSEGSVTLAARGSEGATTVVLLKRFKVENSLKVFKKAENLHSPTDPEPPNSGDTGGGALEGGGEGGAGAGAESGGAGGNSSDAGPDSEAGAEGSQVLQGLAVEGLPLDGVEGLDGITMRLAAIAPRGLAGERGSTSGATSIVLSEPAPRDLIFSVVADPPGAIGLLMGDVITIPAGSRFAGGPLEAVKPGEAFVSVHLLGTDGQLTGKELAVPLACGSNVQASAPELYACGDGDAWRAGSGATIFGFRGSLAPALIIGRLGFSGYDTSPTSVSIAVDDPQGVLPSLPSAVTIPAGEAEVRVELALQDVAGMATLTLRSGEASIDVYIVSRTQGWSALPVIRIPVGATAAVPFELQWPERTSRDIVAVAADASIAPPVPGGESVHLVAGATLEAVTVRGVSVGRTFVRYQTQGLPDLSAFVEVVPARVSVSGGQLRIANLPTGTSGTIELGAQDGAVFSEVTVPPEASAYLSVIGAGTDRVTLRVHPSPDVPDTIALGLRMEWAAPAPNGTAGGDGTAGGAPAPSVIDVDENLEEDIPMPVRNSYRIEADS